MSLPSGYRFTKEHEWVKLEGNKARVGITDYAQTELGDVVFVELPETGKSVKQGTPFSSVESVKAVSDVYSPIDGSVTEVNSALSDSPQLINQEPYTTGWMAIIDVADPAQLEKLMTGEQYQSYLSEIAK